MAAAVRRHERSSTKMNGEDSCQAGRCFVGHGSGGMKPQYLQRRAGEAWLPASSAGRQGSGALERRCGPPRFIRNPAAVQRVWPGKQEEGEGEVDEEEGGIRTD